MVIVNLSPRTCSILPPHPRYMERLQRPVLYVPPRLLLQSLPLRPHLLRSSVTGSLHYRKPYRARRWPWFALLLEKRRKEGEKGCGDTLERLIHSGAKGRYLKILESWFKEFAIECGCGDRKARMNGHYPYTKESLGGQGKPIEVGDRWEKFKDDKGNTIWVRVPIGDQSRLDSRADNSKSASV